MSPVSPVFHTVVTVIMVIENRGLFNNPPLKVRTFLVIFGVQHPFAGQNIHKITIGFWPMKYNVSVNDFFIG